MDPQSANKQVPKQEEKSDSWICPNCNKQRDGKFCQECGSKKPTKKFCKECGKELSKTSKFCPECGKSVE